jgi:BirA family transcriptional regulator, biotin operon repressor / biotin---[acetyl-CoA-carboxylase] ligase
MAQMLGEERARGLTLVADYQERGSGRKGRSWIAPPGTAVLCTIALPDALPASDLWVVPFWSALIVAQAMRDYGATPVVQWPNDLLIGKRKVAGILCISRVIGEYAWVGCGIGVNVLRPSDDDVAGITPSPAFLSDVTRVDPPELLQALLRHADATYDDLCAPEKIAHAWQLAAHIPGAPYRILLDGESEPFDATALRLLVGGALLVEHAGAQREITLANARVLR